MLLWTVHLAKALELKAVVVLACEDEDGDLQEVYDSERQCRNFRKT